MQTVPQGHRLRTWLAASLALHVLLILFLATRKMLLESQLAQVIFMPPEPAQSQAQVQIPPPPPPMPMPQQQQPPQPTQEELDFFLDLHKTTKFGYGEQVKQGEEAGGDESSEPAEVAQKQELASTFEPVPREEQKAPEPEKTHDAPSPTQLAEVKVKEAAEVEKPEKQETRLNEGQSRGGSPGPKTKLARLFEGFLDYMSDPRREEVIDYHAPDKRYVDYMRKVGWALQNSFYLHNKPLTLEHDVHMQVTLVMEIGRNGNLQSLSMTPVTAAEMLNKHIHKIINKAAPFARLPEDFKRTCMKIKLPVFIDAQQGTHTYYLQF